MPFADSVIWQLRGLKYFAQGNEHIIRQPPNWNDQPLSTSFGHLGQVNSAVSFTPPRLPSTRSISGAAPAFLKVCKPINNEPNEARNMDWVAEWKEDWKRKEHHRSPEFWNQRAPSFAKHVSESDYSAQFPEIMRLEKARKDSNP